MTTEPIYRPRKYLSISTLIDFSRCPRRYFYAKCGLTSYDEALAPIYGSGMHAACPVALETSDITQAMSAFLSVWSEVESRMDSEGDPEDPKRNRRTAERSLKHFIHTHQHQRSLYTLVDPPPGAIQTDSKTSRWEVPWAIDIGLDIPLVGRFDAFCVHRDTGARYIWELKTTSRLSSSFFDAHEMSPQNLGYCLVGQTLLGETVEGIMIEGMLVDRNKVENLTHAIPVQQHHLDGILTWLRYTGQQLLDAEKRFLDSNDVRYFVQNFAGCTPYPWFYYPGYRCEYADLCRVPDWTGLTGLFRVGPEHDFLNVENLTIDSRPIGQTVPGSAKP